MTAHGAFMMKIYEDFMQYWAKSLNRFPQPFCSALFTLSSHHPFKIPDRYATRFRGGPKPIHKAMQYTDYALMNFFKTASKMPWYRNTIFVITADHGTATAYYREYQNANGVFSVPIIFFTPDSSLGSFRHDLIQHTDIFPTLIDYLGFNDTIVAFGRSVLNNSGDNLVVDYYLGMYQAYSGGYMLQFDGNKAVALYQFKDDRQLQHNLLGKYPEEEERILLKLKAYIQQYSYRLRENKMVP
jgi:phosphoglycerol transferase MdoB-like AlkP superfamily enzyme